ncbi:hypothetical protein DY000_02009213 [Brassica cretica]|uniref:DUF1985 domain-containing protein n=1 Tax=Brassica cretica TaxID=69181 RepID=A0ABQ7CFP7_BRACR|nr:hypothetical protein DY000_02009213 [Brassica cretica]
MDIPELPPLHDDEYEELKELKLGVLIKFQKLGFDWASRMVHYMLSFQLDINKKYELWSLVRPEPVRFSLLEFGNLTGLNCEYIKDLERPHYVVTKELTSFWEMLGVHVEAGPSTQEIIATFERCKGWSRDDRKRLAKKDFAKPNGKNMRDKMAMDIFQELPDEHEFENKDNDDNLASINPVLLPGFASSHPG